MQSIKDFIPKSDSIETLILELRELDNNYSLALSMERQGEGFIKTWYTLFYNNEKVYEDEHICINMEYLIKGLITAYRHINLCQDANI